MHDPSIVLTIIGMLAALLLFAVRLGMQAGRIEQAQTTVLSKMGALDAIPSLVTRVGNVEEVVKRNTSDITRLREQAAEHRGRAQSNHDLIGE